MRTYRSSTACPFCGDYWRSMRWASRDGSVVAYECDTCEWTYSVVDGKIDGAFDWKALRAHEWHYMGPFIRNIPTPGGVDWDRYELDVTRARRTPQRLEDLLTRLQDEVRATSRKYL